MVCLVGGMSFQWAGVSLALALMLTACSAGSAVQPSTLVVQTNAARTPLAVSTSQSTGSPLQIAQVQIHQNDTTIQIQNTGGSTPATPIDPSGWMLQVGTTSVSMPGATRLPPGQNLVIHARPAPNGSPAPEPTSTTLSSTQTPIPTIDVYLGPEGAVLRDALTPGTTLQLLDPKTALVSEYTLPQT
jgi:hypothetical protein